MAALMNYRVDELKDTIGRIWNRFKGTNFRWYHLISFLAFCALLIFRKSGAGADVLQLARTAAVCVYEWIVTEWKKAFINLGGWVSDLLPAVAIVLFLDYGGGGR